MQAYVKMFFSFLDETGAMTDAEVGRLVRQIMEYGRTGNTEKYLKGNERYAFPLYKAQFDRDRERYVAVSRKRAEAGKSGGMAKAGKSSKSSNCYQTLANASKCYQEEEDKDKDKDKDKDEEEEKDKDNTINSCCRSHLPPLNSVEGYVSSNIDRLSAGNFEELAGFMDDLPEELVRYAVDECCANGKRTFGYLRSILQSYLREDIRTAGEAKARSERFKQSRTAPAGAEKSNPALNYNQRKYTDADFADFFEDLGG